MGLFGRRSRTPADAVDPLQLGLWPARDGSPGWHVRISRRARRLSMRVSPGGRIEVVVPPGVGVPAVQRFVAQHRAWAERRLQELALHAPLAADRRPVSVHLSLTAQRWEVEYLHSSRSSVSNTGDGLLVVRTPQGTDGQVGRALFRWLLREAGGQLRERLDAVAAETGLDYARLLLRRQRTRWGSCSTAGTVSLNVCLMFQRPEVVRYLLVHELCHRRHMNHSAAYWKLVASFEPHWRTLDKELLKGWRNVPGWVFHV
jgi:predicted metal-dependent hydrolase